MHRQFQIEQMKTLRCIAWVDHGRCIVTFASMSGELLRCPFTRRPYEIEQGVFINLINMYPEKYSEIDGPVYLLPINRVVGAFFSARDALVRANPGNILNEISHVSLGHYSVSFVSATNSLRTLPCTVSPIENLGRDTVYFISFHDAEVDAMCAQVTELREALISFHKAIVAPFVAPTLLTPSAPPNGLK